MWITWIIGRSSVPGPRQSAVPPVWPRSLYQLLALEVTIRYVCVCMYILVYIHIYIHIYISTCSAIAFVYNGICNEILISTYLCIYIYTYRIYVYNGCGSNKYHRKRPGSPSQNARLIIGFTQPGYDIHTSPWYFDDPNRNKWCLPFLKRVMFHGELLVITRYQSGDFASPLDASPVPRVAFWF